MNDIIGIVGGTTKFKESAVLPFVIPSTSTCLRQVEGEMNNVCEVVVTAITPNGSAALPFVIPRACDFFDRFVFSARLPDDFSTPSKPVILSGALHRSIA